MIASVEQNEGNRQAQRKAAMAVLAHSEPRRSKNASQAIALPMHENLREPENGLVMVRGRIGGDGAPFNLGEATVSRAAVRLSTGEVGFGYVLGRDRRKARLIALCDAMVQSSEFAAAVEENVLAPLRAADDRDSETGRPRRPRRPGSISSHWCVVRDKP